MDSHGSESFVCITDKLFVVAVFFPCHWGSEKYIPQAGEWLPSILTSPSSGIKALIIIMIPSGSVLKNCSRQCSRNPIQCQGWNLDKLRVRCMPFPLNYLSNPLPTFFKSRDYIKVSFRTIGKFSPRPWLYYYGNVAQRVWFQKSRLFCLSWYAGTEKWHEKFSSFIISRMPP